MNLDIDKEFLNIIERKHEQLNLGKDYRRKFSKIKDFEGNAIGQIGESLVKKIISNITSIIDDGVIHTEYDIKTESGICFEIKTARKGRKNDTFQFNGINPNYNYNYLICLGITEEELFYRIFLKSSIKYIHNGQKHFLIQEDFEKQLVKMNPNNLVNYKLTINKKELFRISNFIDEIRGLCNN